MQWPSPISLRHVALYARDLDAMERFYVDVLGYRVEWRPDADNVYLTRGADNLALHRGRPGGAGALDHIGFVVPTPEDVDRWAAHVAAAGFAPDAPPRTHRDGARSFYLRDPDGNRVQIIHHPPIAGTVGD
ncbi:MAG: VOC family protein [Deltaproteobacteria bacterium]|nr:MAG: VOC family protein [Deltaproteobacteria bacterium]